MEQDRLLKFFATTGMEQPYYKVCREFELLALQIQNDVKGGPERTVALRKLMESRDCIVRAISEQ